MSLVHELSGRRRQELWYLIGIQADITGLSKWNVPEDEDICW